MMNMSQIQRYKSDITARLISLIFICMGVFKFGSPVSNSKKRVYYNTTHFRKGCFFLPRSSLSTERLEQGRLVF